MYKPEKNIAKNIKVIEEQKSELLSAVARLFQSMFQGNEGLILDALCRIVITCHLLARRLGFSYQRLDRAIEQKVNVYLQEKKESSPLNEDLEDLRQYLESYKK
ncbi:MAG: MazG-like family protein [Dethiobacteria bacterium]|nr:hypothetical protein [Bacillota bacterium]